MSGGGAGVEGGGSGHGGGSGQGDGQGGTGSTGGSPKRRSVPVSAVRMLPISDRENSYRLSFLPESTGIARLILDEAGDSSAIPRTDVRAVDDSISLDQVHVKRGQRTAIDITADGPIYGRAWRLSAIEVNQGRRS